MSALPITVRNRIARICICSTLMILLPLITHTSLAEELENSEERSYTLTEIMSPLKVSSSQKIAQQTPIATYNGNVYIVNIEPGEDGDEDGVNLHTTIHQGKPDITGAWSWTKTTLERRTIHDPWHTPPAVGIDKLGYIHVAYNMHNFPWQYSVSEQPDSINSFIFLGDKISLEEIKKAKYENKTSFKTNGYSSIPGNQITYPAFYTNNDGELFVTYRFAAKPALNFESRTMSAGIAKYDALTRQWTSLGGELNNKKGDYKISWYKKDQIPKSLASEEGWTVYHPRMAFDRENKSFITLFWREGVAGETLTKPCVMYTKDFNVFMSMQGDVLDLPVRSEDCSNISAEVEKRSTYNTIGSVTSDSEGTIHIITSPIDRPREIITFKQGTWMNQPSPKGATEIFTDHEDNLWALASGLNIFLKSSNEKDWKHVIASDDKISCFPKATLNNSKTTAYIYSQSCDDSNTVSVHRLVLTQ